MIFGSIFAESQTYGLLWLDVKPADANVSLDEHILDNGVWLLSLAPGIHRLKIESPCCHIYEKEIEIMGGQSLHKEISLELIETVERNMGGKE